MAVAPRIQVSEANGVLVIRFTDRQLFDERTVREVADQILAALPNDGSPIRLILDFTDINLVSSTLLSKLILLQRRVATSGGKLRLCELSPVIQQVFRTANLDRLFTIDRDQRLRWKPSTDRGYRRGRPEAELLAASEDLGIGLPSVASRTPATEHVQWGCGIVHGRGHRPCGALLRAASRRGSRPHRPGPREEPVQWQSRQ